ncbi:hypothetical protein M406DRAFT_296885 [Cryphonectria parasitica EP155]|uniref:Small ribosomal subunit protein uS9m n=1 Tax=Cryphonectria parasitica (strain ATCC 38755 / EP155) TaxID=660469 RepID=A0A9P4XSN4_CRYP1|nr:uncharacterized protein M406DRAFT_296885 [Cryphonectria parasitica EP155]KAF3760201.1 hypothetical protein M406DRAFT_296885 [Cryphonectria parasitica EP155]
MASLRPTLAHLRGRCQNSAPQWQQLRHMMQSLQIRPETRHARPLSTTASRCVDAVSRDDFAAESLNTDLDPESMERVRQMIMQTRMDLAGEATESEQLQTRDRPGQSQEHRPRGRQQQEQQRRPGAGQYGKGDGKRGAGGPEAAELNNIMSAAHARPMPVSPSYFSRQPEFNDSYLQLQKLMRRYAHLPTVPSDQQEKVAFRTLRDYRLSVGEDIKASEYARCMTLVKRLNKIHPKLQTPTLKEATGKFKRDINPHSHKAKEIPIDRFGRAVGVGKRKSSTARAWVVEGTGEVLVNGKSLADAFGRIHDRESAVWALKATARTDKYNVWALVDGGGTTGQAEALAMAVGRALMAHEPALKPALRRAGVITRDPRGVERKKHGHVKARKKPAWVKR